MKKMQIVVSLTLSALTDLDDVRVSDYELADIIEWRADFLSADEILKVAPKVFELFKDFKILFTIRTVKEGGELQISTKRYTAILQEILTVYKPDYIDIEYFSHGQALSALTEYRDRIVLSYHNFDRMPDDLTARLLKMDSEKTAFVKAAIMPERECDVLDLLQITRDMTLEYGDHFITMAMGDMGKVSRITGCLTGCRWTFACLGEPSAPGQIELSDAREILDILEYDDDTE